jgi:antirestriction protein ArdC
MSTEKLDLYTSITNKILADMETGILPWRQSWAGGLAMPLRWTGDSYNGINVLVLWATAHHKGYMAPTWMTFKQALELGAAVRKGEKGTTDVYASTLVKKDADEATGDEDAEIIHYLKSYTVFNVEQIEGLPVRFHDRKAPAFSNQDERNAAADRFFTATGADIRHEGNQPAYSPLADYIAMPEFRHFHSAEDYYSTLAHEMTNWTGHKTRLDREQKTRRDSLQDYAKEELIAELGAAFLCADLAVTNGTRADHAAYIQSWIAALKNDKRFIFSAASQASRAAAYLHGLQKPAERDAA